MQLRRRGLLNSEGDAKCPLCESVDESIDHLLVTLPGFLEIMELFFGSYGNFLGLS